MIYGWDIPSGNTTRPGRLMYPSLSVWLVGWVVGWLVPGAAAHQPGRYLEFSPGTCIAYVHTLHTR